MNRDGINLDEISYRGILMDLLKNVWMIILTAAAVWLGCTGVGKLLYQPQYTASSTLVVTVMGSSNAYSSLSTATQMADVFSEVFQAAPCVHRLKKMWAAVLKVRFHAPSLKRPTCLY